MRLRRLLLVLLVSMTGCAVTTPADLGWTQDAPDFRMTKLEWNLVNGQQNLRHLCGLGNAWTGKACAIRIRESGVCVVFSTFTEEEAKRVRIWTEGWSLWAHEVTGHCAGWGH
jgi:hypothetical protein